MGKSREIARNFQHEPRPTAGNLSGEQRGSAPPLGSGVPLPLFPLLPGQLAGWKPNSPGQEQGGGMRSPSPHTPSSPRAYTIATFKRNALTPPVRCQAPVCTPRPETSSCSSQPLSGRNVATVGEEAGQVEFGWGQSQEKGGNLPSLRQVSRTLPGISTNPGASPVPLERGGCAAWAQDPLTSMTPGYTDSPPTPQAC